MARLLGIDIDKTVVRAALVRTSFKKQEIVRVIEIPIATGLLPASAMVSEPPNQQASIADALRSILQELGQSVDSVAIAQPGADTSIRLIELPAAAAKRIDDVLPFEVEPVLPFPLEESVLDYDLLSRTPTSLKLLVSAARKSAVAAALAPFREVGLDPRLSVPSSVALEGLAAFIPRLTGPSPVLLLALGEDTTDLCFVQNGKTVFARTLSVGFSCFPDQATKLTRELMQTLVAFRATGGDELTELLLVGEGANSPGIGPWLSSSVGVPVNVLAENNIQPECARAVALAGFLAKSGKRTGFLHGEFAPKRTIGAIRQQAPLIAICSAAIVASFGISIWAKYAIISEERERLETALSEATKAAFGEATPSAEHARALIHNGCKLTDPLPQFDALDALALVSASIETGIVHETKRFKVELDEDGYKGRLDLQGTVASIEQRDQIAKVLGEHPCIGEIKKGPTSPGSAENTVNYRLEAEIRCPGGPAAKGKNKNKKASE